MLNSQSWKIVDLPRSQRPLLVVVVDTEEEFDWSRPFSRDNTAVGSIRHQDRAHRIYARYGIRPTYVIDYPVASQAAGYGPLRDLHRDGLCEIGAHLHPWVNPPFDETLSLVNSCPGNLPRDLEREKLRRLGGAIEDNLGLRPTVYKAGRYGVGPATAGILAELGYEIDTSVIARTDMRRYQAPDFGPCGARPYWFGPGVRSSLGAGLGSSGHSLLELPLTAGFGGVLAGAGPALFRALGSALGEALHLPGIFARAGLLERMRLTPEGIGGDELRRLTRVLLARGHRVFTLAFHSPSMAPGNTPYVRSEADLARFLDTLDGYFDFFMGDLGGQPATPGEIRALAKAAGSQAGDK